MDNNNNNNNCYYNDNSDNNDDDDDDDNNHHNVIVGSDRSIDHCGDTNGTKIIVNIDDDTSKNDRNVGKVNITIAFYITTDLVCWIEKRQTNAQCSPTGLNDGQWDTTSSAHEKAVRPCHVNSSNLGCYVRPPGGQTAVAPGTSL
eukprot:scaffold9295_cov34-Prasinocladus_malaysianus.AAC.1